VAGPVAAADAAAHGAGRELRTQSRHLRRIVMPAVAAGGRDAGDADGWTALGASVQLVVTDPARLERGRAMLETQLTAMDAACSRLRAGSELAGLDSRRPSPARVSPLLADAIAAALRTARLTDGDVDPTVGDAFAAADRDPGGTGHDPGSVAGAELDAFLRPAPGWQQVRLDTRSRLLWLPSGVRLDLGATVKAWAADRCAARLAGTLRCGVLVGLGGDIAVAGDVPHGGWRIRVQDGTGPPEGPPPDGPVTVVAIRDGGLATSSTAARRWRGTDVMHYILDPRTGVPAAPFWRTVSVAAATCTFASAASTAAMIRGRRARDWLAALRLPARLVGLDGQVFAVAGWPAGA
jgi:thiamine biosynthesis lipoprotein ApbE